MATDWLEDVKKYVPDADPAVVAAIVRYCGIALQNRDSSLVAYSDPAELDLVRENYLKKKLGLTDPDATLDQGIAAVGERLKGVRNKNRVTVYYLLAEHFGLLGLFGGTASGSGVGAGTAALGAAGLAAGAAAIGGATTPPAPAIPPIAPVPAASEEARFADVPAVTDEGGSGIGKWLPWLLLALLVLALFFGLRSCKHEEATIVTNVTDTSVIADDNATTPAPASAPTIPAGAGVVSGTRADTPMLTVYFDTGKSEVTNALAAASAPLKDYLAAHPGSKLSVSGFNDPTGSAAVNAELSKKRAQGVAAALAAAGIAKDSVVLEKPADTTLSGTTNADARRVEVTVKQ